MTMWARILFLLLLITGISSCNLNSEPDFRIFSLTYDFVLDDSDWTGDFCGYAEGDSLTLGLELEYTSLPADINTAGTRNGFKLSGTNEDGNLFMFLKKRIVGLKPNTTYELMFNVRVASNAITGTTISGDQPGENVYLKAGASLTEPLKELQDGYYSLNLDKGYEDAYTNDLLTLGHMGVSPTTTKYTEITRNNNSTNPFVVTTGPTGELWLILGSDSYYQGTTTLYFVKADILFNQL